MCNCCIPISQYNVHSKMQCSKLLDHPDEAADLRGQQSRLLEGGKVATAIHDVVAQQVAEFEGSHRLRRDEQVLREAGHTRRYRTNDPVKVTKSQPVSFNLRLHTATLQSDPIRKKTPRVQESRNRLLRGRHSQDLKHLAEPFQEPSKTRNQPNANPMRTRLAYLLTPVSKFLLLTVSL